MKKSWHDDMVTIWVSRETRDLINMMRITSKKPTADSVFKMLFGYYKRHMETPRKTGKE